MKSKNLTTVFGIRTIRKNLNGNKGDFFLMLRYQSKVSLWQHIIKGCMYVSVSFPSTAKYRDYYFIKRKVLLRLMVLEFSVHGNWLCCLAPAERQHIIVKALDRAKLFPWWPGK